MKIKKVINCGDFYVLITNHKNPLVYFYEDDTFYDNTLDEEIDIWDIKDDNQIDEYLLLTDIKTLRKIKYNTREVKRNNGD